MSTTVDNPVDALLKGTACVYLSCLRCEIEWHHDVAPTHCPECCDRLEPGRLATAYRRAVRRNGL